MITMKDKFTTRTTKFPRGKREGLPVSTSGTILTGVTGIHSDVFPTSIRSFVRKTHHELAPCHIGYGLGNTMIMYHTVDIQILNGNNAKTVHYFPRFLMRKVKSSIGDTFMDMRDYLSCPTSFGCPDLTFGHLPLGFAQHLLISPEKAWIRNSIARREKSKTFQPDVYADRLSGFEKWHILNFTDKRNKPLSHTGSLDATSLDSTFDRSMNNSLYVANLGQIYQIHPNRISTLGITKTAIPPNTSKSRISWFFASFDPPKKRFEGKVDTHSHILQYLAMNHCQRGTIGLKDWKSFNLVIQAKRFLLLFPSILALFKQVVVKPSAFVKGLVKNTLLFFSWVDSVFKGRLMHNHIVAQTNKRRQTSFHFSFEETDLLTVWQRTELAEELELL